MQKAPVGANILTWCSIKDANRTLFGLEDVDLIDTYTAMDVEEDDE